MPALLSCRKSTPMSRTASPTAQDFVPFATAALDFHRALNVPAGPLVTTRAELDALHAHLVAAARTARRARRPHRPARADRGRPASAPPAPGSGRPPTTSTPPTTRHPAPAPARSPTARRARPGCPKAHRS